MTLYLESYHGSNHSLISTMQHCTCTVRSVWYVRFYGFDWPVQCVARCQIVW